MSLTALLRKHENRSGGNVGWFKLSDDGDTAVVKFLISDQDSMTKFVHEVHKLKISDFDKAVACLGDECPACRAGNLPQLRIWIPLVNLDEGNALQLWERGITDIKILLGELEEYDNLNDADYKIKRNGKKGSTKTTYQFFRKKATDVDVPEPPEILGRQVLELSVANMKKAMQGRLTFDDLRGNSSDSSADEDDDEEDVF